MQIIAGQFIVTIGLSAILILSIAGAYAGHRQNQWAVQLLYHQVLGHSASLTASHKPVRHRNTHAVNRKAVQPSGVLAGHMGRPGCAAATRQILCRKCPYVPKTNLVPTAE